MARSLTYAAPWLPYDGLTVTVDDVAYTIHVSEYRATYPYEQDMVSVMAEPCNKNSIYYQNTRKYLGDDWSLDVLESDNESLFLHHARVAYLRQHRLTIEEAVLVHSILDAWESYGERTMTCLDDFVLQYLGLSTTLHLRAKVLSIACHMHAAA